jgi:hypothetical protein
MDLYQDLVKRLEALAKHKEITAPEMAKDIREAAAVIKGLSRTVYELAHAYVKAE